MILRETNGGSSDSERLLETIGDSERLMGSHETQRDNWKLMRKMGTTEDLERLMGNPDTQRDLMRLKKN